MVRKKNASEIPAGETPSTNGQEQPHRFWHRFNRRFSRKHGTAATAQESTTTPKSANSAQPDSVAAPGEVESLVLPSPADAPEMAGEVPLVAEKGAEGAPETAAAADAVDLQEEKGDTRRDLWKEAVSKIDDGDRQRFSLQENATGDAIKAVGEIEKLCEQYKSSKEEKVLANSIKTVMRKTVEYAFKGKPLVDALVKVDKTGHGKKLRISLLLRISFACSHKSAANWARIFLAALAWSVVSFGLEVRHPTI